MVSPGLAQLIRGEAGSEILPEILGYLAVPAIVAVCCTCLAARSAAYSCNRLAMSAGDAQGVELVSKSSRALRTLLISSAEKVAAVTGQQTIKQHPEELMTRVFATIRSGVMRYLEELTIHVSLRAPWQTIIRNLFHDAVKLGSLIRLKQLDYRVDGPGAGDDDLIADICKHCPDLRMIRFAPSHLWHRNSQAKSDVIAMLTQPCWPRLEQIHLESYASITDFPYAQPEALARALNKTRFPSLAGMAVTLQGSMNADQFIWDVLSNPHATVMPRVRELRFTTVPRPRPSWQQARSSTVWSQDSYRNLPTNSSAANQAQPQPQAHHSETPKRTSEENLEDLTTAALEALKELRLSSLQSVHIPPQLDVSFSCT